MERPKHSCPGVASIKYEYLVQDHVRELDLKFVGNKDIKCIKREADESGSGGPWRKKLKGQNKHRPLNKKTHKSDKLCFKIGTEGVCPFGDNCCYNHDVSTYLLNKPPDIFPECHLYLTFGKCPYSYSCRFGSNHIIDGINITNDDKWSHFKDQKFHFNVLSKDLQKALRRHEYDFTKSNQVFKCFSKTVESNKCKRNMSNLNSSLVSNVCDASSASQIDDKEKNEEQNITENYYKTCNLTEDVLLTKTVPKSQDNNSSVPDSLQDLRVQIDIESSYVEKEESSQNQPLPHLGVLISNPVPDDLFEQEIKKIDFKDKLYLAPLTTVGNLPFRRICKEFGADVTCSEMAMALSLLQGQQSEWALIRRHHTEDIFGIQLCGSHPDVMTRCCQVLSENSSFDFIDLNLGCPLDGIYKKGAGCGLMNRMKKLEGIIYGVSSVISVPLTLKMRTGIHGHENIADIAIKKIKQWKGSVGLITLHGRSREQRYTKSADWDYIDHCSKISDPIPLFGNGDILSYEDYNMRRSETNVSGVMIARGALIKPWIFKEIKDQTHWDISASERFDILKKYANYGLEHWGSDTEGVEKTRRFLLEWLSFLYRYIPVGLLERLPQHINERPPPYKGRNDLETLMASPSCGDWVKISEMLLGPVPENFIFLPKHKANAYK